MAERESIQTSAAPSALGPYSQAIKTGELIFLSGQIPLDPETMELVDGGIETQAQQVFRNLTAIANAAGTTLQQAVKLTIYLTDLNDFARVNAIMAEHFDEPYPARATIQVGALPKHSMVEIDAILAV
ncbi:MAG TPA: reactive intermediate/imine deaminase [Gammaproteobacteria bacterium]|jgi:reactive intermediate/imine deaminase|nr:RidA family protein [Gammaproteobacteria bacterium]MDP6733443.1 RidA family protein [Gammaproteobacteria bacterium]HAJ77360.1 reactive intermediate/imine deaminase [Gammaproteobacteria bacterium]|tara:strand:- start:986 stop:1369 length:384 start_codon:yes stop_codon:yes gene_type:complete